ncbi:glucose dehydrogenase [FAD, quinone]-like [Anopheles marshallii]|uniref:glucose dehydrogenase [FAD, quinone]-like n=1 Tax=Anopheles marshallii TaxID=1521116 RepID=UPI00237AF120|nr:glucose dehydrogenase [FAD, quinone]-like [Anopheles marshallii]
MLGGCSSNNIMLYVRGNSRDYDRWEQLGNPGWGWKDVLEYFKKSEDNGAQHMLQERAEYHAQGGLLKVNSFMSNEMTKIVIAEAAHELGIPEIMDINSDEYIGYNVAQGTVYKGRRWSTAKAFLNTAKDRPNLHIIKNAHVKKINFDGTVATGVTFDLPNQVDISVSVGKEVVLSAGAVNTPQILQLSGVGAKEQLDRHSIPVVKDVPSVGENLQDHVIIPLFLTLHGSRPIERSMDELLDSIYSYFRYGLGTFGTVSVTELLGFVNTQSPAAKFPDIQFHHMLYLWKTPDVARITECFGWEDYIAHQIIEQNQKSEILTVLVTLLNPKSKGSIQLRSSDPHEAPIINANYLDDQRDVKTVIRGIRFFRKLLDTENFGYHELKDFHLKIAECDQLEYDSDSYWECYARYMSTTIYHPTGTAKMGPDGDASAVVDSSLKVRGVQKLRVIDASIMPDIVSGNTNAPTIMIGEKGSDLIKQDYDVKKDSATHTEL